MEQKDFQSLSEALTLRQKMEEVEQRKNPDAAAGSFGTWHKTGGEAEAGQFGSPLTKKIQAEDLDKEKPTLDKPEVKKDDGSILSVILNRLMNLDSILDYILWAFLILLILVFLIVIFLYL